MHIQLILAACLLGPILASPIPEDTCDGETKRWRECFEKYDRGITDWWDDSFLEKLFPLQLWKDCVGEVKCERVKKMNEVDEMKYNAFVYFHINLRRCLGKATIQKIWDTCETPEQWKVPCEDRTDFDCMESKMMQHEHCSDQDVEALDNFVPFLIKYRNLLEEVWHGGRKCEGTMDGSENSEIPKLVSRVALSSFHDIAQGMFTR
ncbi:hypothetical protein CAEBREN_12149 [Caenorhabditis brenneri]|uniref:DUF19 domain-containing protein n=1 Tax=Caenorhabditis brenneri TaxID=135651 RepID=G0NNP1_CAEBE|nr:hypothetical protein CAEBREN_12149 [Caenorhabditis brenneri]